MAASSSIQWDVSELRGNLQTFEPKLEGVVWAVMNMEAPNVQGYAQANASWRDQTGNARQGLKARAMRQRGSFAIVLFHTMPYGIYLETRWSGRYAIIKPTIQQYAPRVMATLAGAIGRIR